MTRISSLLFISLMLLILLMGCADREEYSTAIGSTPKADAALKEAEKNLKDVGVIVSFKDPGELAHPQNLVPKPENIASQEKQKKIADAIVQLNIVISEIEQEAKLAPPIGSVSDRGIVHFYLGLAYLLDAISRLLISDDPKTTFIIEYNPNANSGEWFTYGISNETKAKLDSIKNPLEYPNAFTEKERQAIIDALDLINDAVVKPKSPDIKPQSSTVNGPPYLHSAIWHFKKAIGLLGEYNAELRDALKDFNSQIDKFESIIKQNAELWGFSYTSSQEG
ncbi:MAG: hypothetical protein ACPL7B_02135 [Candidatus Poribacteria bacterium]